MKRPLRALMTGGTAFALTLAVASCGSGTVADPGADDATAVAGKISIETAKGTVELPEPATKVVSLEWSYTEELLALGVTPVGVADSENYGKWVSAPGAELPEGIADVGLRQEPSIETIKSLKPDLIVSDEERITANFDQLNEIAPVVAFDPTAKPQLDTMKKNFGELAEAVGKQDKAKEVLGKLDAKVDEVKSNASGTFALAQGYTSEGAPGIRMFTTDSFAASLLESAGLRNGWAGQPDAWGMTTIGVEGLTKVAEDATFLYVALKDDDPFTGALAKNSVWQELPFVAQDKVRALDPGTWLFGGPLSAIQLLDETAKAMNA
ncbi:MAG: ABC transporter substrate-binding protein [Pseudonocardiaceae bacterium]